MGCAELCRVSGTGGGWNSDETVTCCREDLVLVEFEFGQLLWLGRWSSFIFPPRNIHFECKSRLIPGQVRPHSTPLFTRKFGLEFDQRMSRSCDLSFDLPRPSVPSTTHALGVGVWTIAQCWASRMIWPCAATDRGRAMATWVRTCVRAHHAESWRFNTPLLGQQLGVG